MFRKTSRNQQARPRRRGAAAVEFAVAAPVLVLLVLGMIDVGQFMNVGQVISNASRVGARKAARFDTKVVTDVRTEVLDYLEDYLTGVSRASIDGALTVTVKDSGGSTISGNGLASMSSGDQVQVQVQFNFGTVRWFDGFDGLDNKNLSATSMMRRL